MSTRRDFLSGQPLRDAMALATEAEAEDEARGAAIPFAGNTVRLGKVAMASDFEVILNPDSGALLSAASDALELIDRLEEQMSVFRPTSELSRLNARAAEEPVVVEKELYELLQRVAGYSTELGGAFDPTAGPLVRLWRQCRRERRIPTESELAAARARRGVAEIEFDDAHRTIRFRRTGIELNLNAVGKGYALDRAAALLEEASRGREPPDDTAGAIPGPADLQAEPIDVRPPIPGPSPARGEGRTNSEAQRRTDAEVIEKGPLRDPQIENPKSKIQNPSFLVHGGYSSILARGSLAGSEGWPVAIRHPLFPNKCLATLLLKDRGMSTSGSGVQFYRVGGKRYGHLLDPRTGWPAEGILTVTVLAPTAALAEVLSTAFFVLGVEMAREYCHNHSDVAALIVPAPSSGSSLEPVYCGLADSDLILEPEAHGLRQPGQA